MKKKKEKASLVFLILVLLCLLGIGAVTVTGFLRSKPDLGKLTKPEIDPSVLGEIFQPQITNTTERINQFMGGTFSQTKEIVSEKVVEMEKEIVTNIQKEISTLTQSQVETIKEQICKDLGVLKP